MHMKIQAAAVFLIILLFDQMPIRAQDSTKGTTNATVSTNGLVYELKIGDTRKIKNPTEDDIRAAVKSLGKNANSGFLILGTSETTYVQVWCDEKDKEHPENRFEGLEYQENDLQHHYKAEHKDFYFSESEIAQILISYLKNDGKWKKETTWKKEVIK